MKKSTKLIIAFVFSLISALLMPIFTQWYEQVIGVQPVAFSFVYAIGSFISIYAIASNNFKDF